MRPVKSARPDNHPAWDEAHDLRERLNRALRENEELRERLEEYEPEPKVLAVGGVEINV